MIIALLIFLLKIVVFFIGFVLAVVSLLKGLINKVQGKVKRAVIIWVLTMVTEFIIVGIEYIVALKG